MNRLLTILLALTTLVPMTVPAAGALASQPGAQPTSAAPATPSGPAEDIGLYLDEGFEDLDGWEAQRFPSDTSGQDLWEVAPRGEGGDPAATLAGEAGLPGGVHQALVSDPVDITPVPSRTDDGSADEAGVASTRATHQATRSAVANLGAGFLQGQLTGPFIEAPTATTGSLEVPQGPAYLTLIHRYSFDDRRNERGQAIAGFTIEARAPQGDWEPLEPSVLVEPARGLDAPGPRQGSESIADATGLQAVDPCQPADLAAAILRALGQPGESECDADPYRVPQAPDGDDALLALGDSVTLQRANDATGAPVPALAEAEIAPLDAQGYTGTSEDRDEDGRPDPVGHIFDLSAFAGQAVELRFRAGTHPLAGSADSLWAIDEAQVRAGAHVTDLRVQLDAPAGEHLAPADQAFPLTVAVQNTGLTQQEGPFEVDVTVTREATTVLEETLTIDGELGFLDRATGSVPLAVTDGTPYTVTAQLAETQVDAEPRNDEATGQLPVGTDASVAIDVQPADPTLLSGQPAEVTTTVTSLANVPVSGELVVQAAPYDADLDQPLAAQATVVATREIDLPAAQARHPDGQPAPTATVQASASLPDGAYVLVATLADEQGTAPLGVAATPPPVMADGFEDIELTDTTFELETGSGTWTAHGRSDLGQVAPVIDPGDRADGSAWVPTEHDHSVVRPCGDEVLAHASISVGELLYSGSDKPGRCDLSGGGSGWDDDGDDQGEPKDVDGLDPVTGFCLLGLGPCLVQEEVDLVTQAAAGLVGNSLPDRAGVYLESPRGTQRLYGMAHDVRLDDVDEAQLSLISKLIEPHNGTGITEARVYVTTRDDLASLGQGLAERCADLAPDQPCRMAASFGATGDALIAASDDLERDLRCQAIPSLLGPAEQPAQDNGAGEIHHAANATYGPTAKGLFCPAGASPTTEATGGCIGYAGSATGEAACYSNERSRAEVLATALAGEMVARATEPHPWQRSSLDLSAYTGQNVTLTILLLAESDHGTQRLATAGPASDDAVIGYGAPDRPQGALLLDRISVQTDKGLRLAPSNTTLASSAAAETAANAAQEHEPGTTTEGWRTLGYRHLTGLGPSQAPLRSSAQVLIGDGMPGAEGTDPTQALQLGVREGTDTGVLLRSNISHHPEARDDPEPQRFDTPQADAAVTTVASPVIDLSGTQHPVASFQQRFDLASRGHGQPVVGTYEVGRLSASLGISLEAAALCGVGPGQDAGVRVQIDFDKLACLLDRARAEDPDLDVQEDVFAPGIKRPAVAAGMFARVVPLDGPTAGQATPVAPVDGYRFPTTDPGAFRPTLGYTLESQETTPGYTNSGRCPFQTGGCNQATYTQIDTSRFQAQPVWAGDSDVDRDGQADWVPSRIDLSPWAGQRVRLEWVLVARTPSFADALTELPWQIDQLTVTETPGDQQVDLAEVTWPTTDLPLATPGQDLPVRTEVTTPTGVTGDLSARARLFDAEGCLRGQDSTTASTPSDGLAPGQRLALGTMTIDGAQVAGPSPWTLEVEAATGQPPTDPATADVRLATVSPGTERHPITDAIDATTTTRLDHILRDPGCAPQGLVTALHADGDGQLTLHQAIAAPGDDLRATLLDGTLAAAGLQVDLTTGPAVLSVSQGIGRAADGHATTLHADDASRTIGLEAPDRITEGALLTVEAQPATRLDQASLATLPLTDGLTLEDATTRWTGALPATATTELPLRLSAPGPHLVLTTGQTPDGSVALGATVVTVTPGQATGDPIALDRRATLDLAEGRQDGLAIEDLTVSPVDGLDDQPRQIAATVRNTGTSALSAVEIDLTADGALLTSATQGLAPGEATEITVEHTPTGDARTLIGATATAGDLSDTAAVPIRSLVDLGALTPTLGPASDGWQVDGTQATFGPSANTTGRLNLTGASLTRLADARLLLDHTMDMETGFDGGNVLLSTPTGEESPLPGEDLGEMSPYSPEPGPALTGQRSATDAPIDVTPAATQVLREETATGSESLGPGLTADGTGWTDETAPACQSRSFTDDPLGPTGSQATCYWSHPMLPVPRSAAETGLWHLHPGATLSPTGAYNVTIDGTEHRIEANELTHVLMLEAGEDLVQAAQTTGSLTVTFDEARLLQLDNTPGRGILTVQTCARFVDLQPAQDGDGYAGVAGSTRQPVAVRCTGLTHDQPQEETVPWRQTTLRFGDIPDGSFDIVRLELSLREDRGYEGGGILNGDTSAVDATSAQRIEDRALGWFLGPVSAEAGTAQVTWTPEAEAMDTTDPMTGLTPDQLAQKDDFHRYSDVIDQAGLVIASEVLVDGEQRSNVPSQDLPVVTLPLSSCSWWREASTCSWAEVHNIYAPLITDETRALASLPYALDLACELPDGLVISRGEHAQDCDPRYTTGLGPQVVSLATLDNGAAPGCGQDQTVTQPLLWRTRCLHAHRIDRDGEPEPEGPGIRIANADMDEADRPPVPARGHGIDVRLGIPVDLSLATGQTWFEPDIEIPSTAQGNRHLPALVRAEARVQDTQSWQSLDFCDRETDRCLPTWGEARSHLDLTRFAGHPTEVALRVEIPHPTVKYEDKLRPEGVVEYHGYELETRGHTLAGTNLSLQAWTDRSVQGDGWTVDEARLYGLPIEANVGLTGFDSPLGVFDAWKDREVLHVHVNDTASQAIRMQIPAEVTLYNQGPSERNLAMDGSVLTREGEVHAACEVSVVFGKPGGDLATHLTLPPGTSKVTDVLVRFDPIDRDNIFGDDDDQATPEDCFPGEAEPRGFSDHPEVDDEGYRLRLALAEDTLPARDAFQDDAVTKALRVNPFVPRHNEFDGVPDEHAPQLAVEALEVTPTRPTPGETIEVTAKIHLQDSDQRAQDLTLTLTEVTEEGNETVLAELDGFDAEPPAPSLAPYETRTVTWRFEQPLDQVGRLDLNATIDRGTQQVSDLATAWLAGKGDVLPRAATGYDELVVDGDVEHQGQEGPDGELRATPTTTDPGDRVLRAVVGTPWMTFEGSPPPLVSVRARWGFDQVDDPRATGADGVDTYAGSGWAIQVCHWDEQAAGACPLDTDPETDASNWQTTQVLDAPAGTLGILSPSLSPPDTCDQGVFTTTPPQPPERCSSAAERWSGFMLAQGGSTLGGEPVLAGTNPGFDQDPSTADAWTTVIASATTCTEGPALEVERCLPWGPDVRDDAFRFRVVAFSTPEADQPRDLTVSHLNVSAAGVSVPLPTTTADWPIPAEADKVVGLAPRPLGPVGVPVTTDVQAPSGWQAGLEGLQQGSVVEPGSQARLVVRAPSTAAGGQGAIDVRVAPVDAPGRTQMDLLPVPVQSGVPAG